MAIVFAGAAIGSFLIWPMIRPAFISAPPPQGYYAGQAQPHGYGRAEGETEAPPRTTGTGRSAGPSNRHQDCTYYGGRLDCGPWQDGRR